MGMACFSATLTSLSMSGIATNGRVSAGGCYQIIKVWRPPRFPKPPRLPQTYGASGLASTS